MATLSHSESRRLYSWWWDSHISPKNSKWLQENLSDMDRNVKAMLKLIEEDADSFASRAEMYYQKRPELIKLVEEFYRAYRALAERYDHATGALRQAHCTMAEAFPNQIPLELSDDSPSDSSASVVGPHTPEMHSAICALLDPEDLHKDALDLSSQYHTIKVYTEESDALESIKGLKQLDEMFPSEEKATHSMFPEGRERRSLSFHDEEEKEDFDKTKALHEVSQLSIENQNLKTQFKLESERATKAEAEVQTLQEALQVAEAQKEAVLLQYKLSLERASNLETEMSHTLGDFRKLNDEKLVSVNRIKSVEERCLLLEKENQSLQLELGTVAQQKNEQHQEFYQKCNEIEKLKSSLHDEHMKSAKAEVSLRTLEKLHTQTQEQLRLSALEVESKVEALRDAELQKVVLEGQFCWIKEENDHLTKELMQKLEQLEQQKSCVHCERMQSAKAEVSLRSFEKLHAKSQEQLRLSALEVENKVEALKNVELQKVVLESQFCWVKEENDHLTKELKKKLEELEKLNTAIQEENVRSIQAEEALKSLEKKYSQSQEDLHVLASHVQNKADICKEMEFSKQNFEDEVLQLKKENETLNEKNVISAQMNKDLQDQIISLKETIGKLDNEVVIHVNEKKVLQQEICCLKEQINNLHGIHEAIMGQIEALGLVADSFQASIKELQNENMKLQGICEEHEDQKVLVLEKLGTIEKISGKNAILENSLLDATVELERLREKVRAVEESLQTLRCDYSAITSEKGVLLLQIETIAKNMEKLSDSNTFLENSLSDAHTELLGLRQKMKILEESHQSLVDEKSNLLSEKSDLISQVESIRESLMGVEKRDLLKLKTQEHKSVVVESKSQLDTLKEQIIVLREKNKHREEKFKQGQYELLDAYIDIFVMQNCLCDLNERNLGLVSEHQRFLEAYRWAEKLITDLKQENLQQFQNAQMISEHNEKLTEGLNLLPKALHVPMNHGIIEGTDDRNSLLEVHDKNHDLHAQRAANSTLLQQHGLDVADLISAKKSIEKELAIRNEEMAALQRENHELHEMNGQLRKDMHAGYQREQVLKAEPVRLQKQLTELQMIYQKYQTENFKFLEEKQSLLKEISTLREEKDNLEEDMDTIILEGMALHCLSLILEQSNAERAMYLKMSSDNIRSISAINNELGEKLKEMMEKIEVKELQNSGLHKSAVKSEECRSHAMILEDNPKMAGKHNEEMNRHIGQLNKQLETGKHMLNQKEVELSEANQMFHGSHIQNFKLHRDIEDIKMEHDEAKVVREDLEKKLLIPSEDVAYKDNEIICAQESNKNLGLELCRLHDQIEELSSRENQLPSEVSNEEEVATLHDDLQTSIVHSVVFEDNFLELIGACQGLEINAMVQRKVFDKEITSRETFIDSLSKKLDALDKENIGLKSKLGEYLSLVTSLCTRMSHLEDSTSSSTNCFVSKNQEIKDDLLLGLDQNRQELSKDHSHTLPDGIELQKLQAKVEALRKLTLESSRLVMQEKSEVEVSKVKPGFTMKDIQLDHVLDSYNDSRIENAETDPQILELWETTERDCNSQLKRVPPVVTEKDNKDYHQIEAVEKENSGHPSSELVAEKELAVDKIELGGESHEERNERLLEQLASDAQRLSILEITVQELKMKMEKSERISHHIEFDTKKEQLKEAEEAILELVDVNRNLTYKAKTTCPLSSDKMVGECLKLSNQQKRQVPEIGRLELELITIQYFMLKLQEVSKDQRIEVTERSPKVLLKDYIHEKKEGFRRKKAKFCGCVRPKTKDS